MKIGRYILIAALFVAMLGTEVAGADGGYTARARQPVYESSSLQLIGAGAFASESGRASLRVYRTEIRHPQLRVTVCLRKRFGRQSFDVRCETASKVGRRVKAQVSVPGCVAGVWRTTTVGEAFDREGALLNQSTAVSRKFRC